MIETFYNWDGPTVVAAIAIVIFIWSLTESYRARARRQTATVKLANAAQAIATSHRNYGTHVGIPKGDMDALIDALLDFRSEVER